MAGPAAGDCHGREGVIPGLLESEGNNGHPTNMHAMSAHRPVVAAMGAAVEHPGVLMRSCLAAAMMHCLCGWGVSSCVVGCRSVAERTYVTKVPGREVGAPLVNSQAAWMANGFGRMIERMVTGRPVLE
jgi:hypothetical protein